MTIHVTSTRTSDEITRMQMSETELLVRTEPHTAHVGDDVKVTTTDGESLIGCYVTAVDDEGTDECGMSAHIHVGLS